MRRLIKSLFGRFAIVGMSVILHILILCLLNYYVTELWWEYQLAMQIISIIVFLRIVNRDMVVESKLPWVVFILVIPVFGVVVYVVMSENRVPKKQALLYKSMYNSTQKYTQLSDIEIEYCKDAAGEYFGQMEYLINTVKTKAYTNTETKYYPNGELFWADLLNDLHKAQKFIFLEYFIIERGVMWNAVEDVLLQKVKQGVDVRVLYDDIGSIGKVSMRFARKLRKLGIKCYRFSPFRPFAAARHNNRDHRKIAVIDGLVGYTGGINLADEYINVSHPYGYWKDTAIRLKGDGVNQLIINFMMMWCGVVKKQEEITPFLNQTQFNKKDDNGIVVPYTDGPKPLYPEYIGRNAYLNLIYQAKKYLWITTPYLIMDNALETALKSAAMRGVDVRIVTPKIPDKKTVFMITRSSYEGLQKAGVRIFEYEKGFIHAKQFLCDDVVGIIGSINLDYRSLMHHYECAVLMYKTKALIDIKADFIDTFNNSIDMDGFKQKVISKLFCGTVKIFTPLL